MLLEFENKLASFIKAHDLFGSAPKVVLAISGGADSMALLYAMQTLKTENILEAQFVCAHIDHQLRGAEADLDEEFVVTEASRLKLHVITKRVNVRGFARDHKLSIETAARQCRMKALIDIAKTNECDRVATAHQKNDNAETVLHRLVRGTGFRGLGGIWPKRIFAGGVTFIRPMLSVTREEVIDYLQSQNLMWRRDRTNVDCTYRRNFIRRRLLPALQRDCRDPVVETLSELARSAHQCYGRIYKRVDEVWPELAECTDERMILDLKKFNTQPPPVKIELIRRSLTHIGCGQRDLTRRHYEWIVQLAGQNVTGKRIELPDGFVAQRQYGNMIFSQYRRVDRRIRPVRLPWATARDCPYVKIPGQTRFGKYLLEAKTCKTVEAGFESGDFLSCHFDRRSAGGGPERRNLPASKQRSSYATRCLDWARHDKKRYVERFDLEKLKLPLTIRLRRPGDRFVPLGLDAEKKIGKFLTAQQVPHEIREKVVLTEDQEKIIWIWPIRISERAKITPGTRQILQLQITYSGDPQRT